MKKIERLKMDRVDGLYVRNNYSDYDHWVNWEDIEEILKEAELNENQLVVLNWIKEELACFNMLETISQLAFLDSTGGKMKWGSIAESWLVLNEKEKCEVLASFAEWGLNT